MFSIPYVSKIFQLLLHMVYILGQTIFFMGCMGCQVVVVPLMGEHVMLLGVVCPFWSSPVTQLSLVAPHSSCMHAAVATPWATALTGQQNQVRVANGFETLNNAGTFSSQHTKTALVDQAEEISMTQRLRRQCSSTS